MTGDRWFPAVHAVGVMGCAGLTWRAPDLVWLNIAAQVANAVLLPVLVGTLVVLAATALPLGDRLRGWYLALVAAACTGLAALGLVGAAGSL